MKKKRVHYEDNLNKDYQSARLENKPSLRKLLKLFRDNENKALTFTDIIIHMKGQETDPLVDYNYVYIAIHRLRKFLKPNERLTSMDCSGYRYNTHKVLKYKLEEVLGKISKKYKRYDEIMSCFNKLIELIDEGKNE